ncbi:tetratricopeptide repeat protein, partial [Acinetobacter baumannii]
PWPDELAALIGLGNLYYQKKQWVAAEQQYRRATQVHPTSGDTFNNLAQVLLDQQQWQAALQAAQIAVSLGGVRIDIYQATL